MRFSCVFGLTLLSSILCLGVAKADSTDLLDSRGFYIGGAAGFSQIGVDAISRQQTSGGFYWREKSHADRFNGELRAGFRVKYRTLYVAGELFGNLLNSKTVVPGFGTANTALPKTLTADITVSMKYLYGFRGKVGINLSDKISLYGIVGFAQAPVSINSINIDVPMVTQSQSITLQGFDSTGRGDGLLYGVGLSFDATERISLTAEYHIARFTLDHLIDSIETYRYLNLALHSSNIQTLMIGANFLF